MVFEAKVIFFLAVPFCTESLKFHWARDATGSCKTLSREKAAPVTKRIFILAHYFGVCAWGKRLLHSYTNRSCCCVLQRTAVRKNK